MTYRTANKKDIAKIAKLHAKSWKENYQHALSEEYLKNYVDEDRLTVWMERLKIPNAEQYVVLAEKNKQIVGFACTYLNAEFHWGALLDNIHVDVGWQGKGIGRELLIRSARWVFENDPFSKLHLWVLLDNESAIDFYRKNGGEEVERKEFEMPDGNIADAVRFVWMDLKKF